jgi:hypothetical protein
MPVYVHVIAARNRASAFAVLDGKAHRSAVEPQNEVFAYLHTSPTDLAAGSAILRRQQRLCQERELTMVRCRPESARTAVLTTGESAPSGAVDGHPSTGVRSRWRHCGVYIHEGEAEHEQAVIARGCGQHSRVCWCLSWRGARLRASTASGQP